MLGTGCRRFALVAASAVLLFGQPASAAPAPYIWKTVPYGGGGYVTGFVYHPKTKDLLYARTDIGGAYRFDFPARRWIPLQDHLSRADGDLKGVLSIALDPNQSNKVYLACGLYVQEWGRKAAILSSDDRGATWRVTELPFRLGGNADGRGTGDRLQVDPNLGGTLFLGTNQDGLWKSADAARSFARVGSFPAKSVTLVLFDPASGARGSPTGTIYVGSGDDKGALLVSKDGGATFAEVPGAPRQIPQHAAIGPDGFLYVAFAQGDGNGVVNPSFAVDGSVWKMELKSGRWTNITPIKPVAGRETFGYSGIDVDPAHPGTIVVSTLDRWWPNHDDIFVSRDGGAHWMGLEGKSHHDVSRHPWLANNQHTHNSGKDLMGSWISDVKFNPFDPDQIIYGTGYGLWMSRNLTAAGSGKPVEFEFAVDNFEETAVTQLVSPSAGATVMASMGDVAGAAWDDITKPPTATGIFKTNTMSNWSVDVASLTPEFIARSIDREPYGLFSKDGGESWTAFPSAPPFTPKDAQGNWRTIGPLAVSAGATSILWAPQGSVAYRSVDVGKSWKPVSGWPSDANGQLVPIADKAVDNVFYVLDRVAGRLLASSDGGANFKPIVEGLPSVAGWQTARLAVVPGRFRDLWLAGPFGLLHSGAADKPMAPIQNVEEAWLVSFGKAAPGQNYPAVFLDGKVKGVDGIWRSDDEGRSWVRINDDVNRFGGLSAMAGDPMEHGTVYIAPHGRGVIVGKPAR